MSCEISVYSEIGTLSRVLLHRPGRELENLMPDSLNRLLFDDIPDLKTAQREHDEFASLLSSLGIEVVYLTKLLETSLSDPRIKQAFTAEFVGEALGTDSFDKEELCDYLLSLPTNEMIDIMIAGLRKSEYKKRSLSDHLESDYPFILDPMPNLYFTRDPFAAIGCGIALNKMSTATRSRETLFAKYIFTYHPLYKNTPLWYERSERYPIEGGDVLVLNRDTVAVGISQRTHPNAIEHFAEQILSEKAGFSRVLAINIPKERTFMHLDTVFTMVDRDKFTVHPNIREAMQLYVLSMDGSRINITEEQYSLEDALKKHLGLDHVELIRCGDGSVVDAAREQWNDGSNTLAVAPGEVVVYSRNYVTNQALRDHGIKVHEIASSELSRGRGGPRCMSMPLKRGEI